MDLNYGYVIVTGTKAKGRIGRYKLADSETGKAIVYWSYEGDLFKYTNCSEFTLSNLSNDISLNDVVDRYFVMKNELLKIDMRAHSTIKKHSDTHKALMCEFNLICSLFMHMINNKCLSGENNNRNVFVFYSFLDNNFMYEFAADLEYKKFNVSAESHEITGEAMPYMNFILASYENIIFIISKNSIKEQWLKNEYVYCKNRLDIKQQDKIKFVQIDNSAIPEFITKSYDLSKNYLKALDDLAEEFK